MATLDEVLARPNLTYADRDRGVRAQGLRRCSSCSSYDRRRGRARRRGRRVAQGAAHRGPVLHRDGALLSRRARAPEVRRGADPAARRRRAASPTSRPSACSRSQAYDRWKESARLQARLLGDRVRLPDVADLRRAVGGHRQGAVPEPTSTARPAPTYVAEVHDRVREHLEKALEGHRMNVELAKAFGVETVVEQRRSEQRAVQIMDAARPRRRRRATSLPTPGVASI